VNPLQELSLVSEDAETIRYCDELGTTTRTEHALIRELGAGDRVYKRQGAIAKSKEPVVVMVSRAGAWRSGASGSEAGTAKPTTAIVLPAHA
jgi:hypothetical protein